MTSSIPVESQQAILMSDNHLRAQYWAISRTSSETLT